MMHFARLSRQLLLSAVIAFATNASAESPPRIPFEAMDWPALMHKEPNRFVYLGSFRIYFERTTLDEVLRAVGIGTIAQEGDGGEHQFWLCYTATHEGIRSRLWIISHGEMGGDSHVVTSFASALLDEESPTPACPDLPTKMEPAGLEPVIWLQSSDEELEKYIGTPSYKDDTWRVYTFRTKIPGKCEGGFDRLNWMTTKMKQGRIALIQAGQVTSC
jgi:hypothetical protein